MGLFDKILGKNEQTEVPDLEEVMQSADGDAISPPADFYVKRVDLRNEGDADLAIKELSSRNIVILNLVPLSKQPNRLKGIISKLKVHTGRINGDIAVISSLSGNEMIMLTQANVKIVKSKPKAKPGATVIS